LSTVKLALVPPKATVAVVYVPLHVVEEAEAVPQKPDPVMITELPPATEPPVGFRLATTGPSTNMNWSLFVGVLWTAGDPLAAPNWVTMT
jgi:hypothetical protein